MQCKYNLPTDAQGIVWNRISNMRVANFWSRGADTRSHMCESANAEEKKRRFPQRNAEELDVSKWWFAEYIRAKTNDFMRQSNFNSIRALAHAAECGIIFISFRTSPKSFRRLSHPAPPRSPRPLQRPFAAARGASGADYTVSHRSVSLMN